VAHSEDGTGGRPQTDAGLASSRPPSRFSPVRTWQLNTVRDLSVVRKELLLEVTADHAPVQVHLDRVPENMVLVASELATNALEHGRPPTSITLSADTTDYLLDVCDSDVNTAPVVAGARPTGAGGFGLVIARRLSQDVGWYTTHDTKHVWAIFPAQG
jgi:anti-sigma regulatory factor (Ser/Thr protein kinase)